MSVSLLIVAMSSGWMAQDSKSSLQHTESSFHIFSTGFLLGAKPVWVLPQGCHSWGIYHQQVSQEGQKAIPDPKIMRRNSLKDNFRHLLFALVLPMVGRWTVLTCPVHEVKREYGGTLRQRLRTLLGRNGGGSSGWCSHPYSNKNNSSNKNNNKKSNPQNKKDSNAEAGQMSYATQAKKGIDAKQAKQKVQIRRVQGQRLLQKPTGPSEYEFVYLPAKRYIKYQEMRKILSSFKIPTSRILDIQFPARGTVALLVNGEFREELIALLGKAKVVPLGNFDLTAADVIADPKLMEEAIKVMARKAQDLFDARLVKASLCMTTYLGHGVTRNFSSKKAVVKISETAVSDYLEGRKTTSTTAPVAPTNDMDGIESTKTPITTTHE
ncbi:hypothetical protein J3Q64DRAFT_1855963 [Phycomyces blakesleeanus]|uniref:Uncharacterized protein n=1 Tax=Phycomyces blakesleeanus TaxID=4837 RepID=A0ABR3BDN0_PHYBL